MTKKESFIQFLKFLFFSCAAGIIQISAFIFLNEVCKIPYFWVSYLISLVLSVTFNFIINRKFTFKSVNNVYISMLLAFLFYIPFAPYSTFLEHLLTQKGLNEYLVTFINMVQNFILEFLWWKFVIYRKKNLKKPPDAFLNNQLILSGENKIQPDNKTD